MVGVADAIEIQPKIEAAPGPQSVHEIPPQAIEEEGLVYANQDVGAETIPGIENEEAVEPHEQIEAEVEQPQVV